MSRLPLIFLLTSACLFAADYGSLVIVKEDGNINNEAERRIDLNAGDLIEILSGFSETTFFLQGFAPNSLGNEDYYDLAYVRRYSGFTTQTQGMNAIYSPLPLPLRFVGPMTIVLSSYESACKGIVSYKLNRSDELSGVSSRPASTVVIPTDANGNVEIILESSTDLVNWTAASPGEYSSATQNRFFRVGAVVTGD
jgi:hypothetical protein